MKRKGFLLAVMLVLVFGVVQVATAADGTSSTPPQQKMNKVDLLEELDLTDEQIDAWKEIKEDAYQDTRALRIEMMDLEHELDLLMLEGDEDQVSDKREKIKAVRDEIMEIEKACLDDLNDLLTDEQQNILEANGGKGLGLGHGFGPGHGPGPDFEGKGQCPNPQNSGNED